MRQVGAHSRTYRYLGFAQGVLLFLVTALGTMQNWEEKIQRGVTEHAPELVTIFNHLLTHAWWYMITCAVLIGMLKVVRNCIGIPWAWDTVHEVLEALRCDLYPGHSGAMDEHQITLFKHTRWAWRFDPWPWSVYLVPVERSGHLRRKSSSVFAAPDNSENVQGVAGAAWRDDSDIYVSKLPLLKNGASDKDIATYAENTWVTPEWVKKKLKKRKGPMPRAYLGIAIEANFKRWGVIVIDSAAEEIPQPEALSRVRFLKNTLNRLLGGMKA